MANSEGKGKLDITEATLRVLFIGMFIVAGLWILSPFLTSLVWASIIVVATWPVMLWVQARLRGRRALAVAAMTLGMIVLVLGPILTAILTVLQRSADMAQLVESVKDFTVPAPPESLVNLPVVGDRITHLWSDLSALNPQQLSERLMPYALAAGKWFAGRAGSLAILVVEFALTVVIASILYAKGEEAAEFARKFGKRLAGQEGEASVDLAARAVRGVALGVVGTAALQSMVGGLGLLVTGVPGLVFLCALMFILCLAQVGPVLVLAPAVAWLYWKHGIWPGTVLLAFTAVAVTMDNVIRPILIRRGVDMPLVMIFAGVIGGLMAFGVIGLFIGPTVLAVGYTLLKSWVQEKEGEAGCAD